MNIISLTLGIVLCALFFLNIKNTADIFCRICGGFAALIAYNTIAQWASLSCVGINLLSSLITGILGLPGGILLIVLSTFF